MADGHLFSFGPYQLDIRTEQLRCATQLVRLTPKAFQLLCYVVERSGQLVTKEELFQVVWTETVVSDAALTTCVQEIRKALQDDARNPVYLETVHRRGFRFIGQVVSQKEVASSQRSVVSSEEPSVNGQASEAVMPAKAGIQEAQPEAASESPWIPESVGMTPPLATPQTHDPSPQPDQLLDASAVPAQGSWSARSLMVMSLGLLVCVLIAIRSLPFSVSNSEPPTPNSQTLPLPDKPSLIVLPFVNMSKDPDQEYFSDGITEDLTTALAKVSALFVVARSSAFVYKGKPVDLKAVSRELGVRYVLEGSVQKANNRVRITTQLVDSVNAVHIWAESYDRELKDIFAVQDEVRQKVVLALKVKLTAEEQERFRRYPTDNLEAYEYLLRGVEFNNHFTKEDNAQARQMFERARTLDPQYAGAYAWLGVSYMVEWSFHWDPNPQNLERAFALEQQAIALDDSNSDAHQILSQLLLWGKQPEQARAEAERAVALNPNYADNYGNLADILNFIGRPEEAISQAKQALRLNPRGLEVAWYLSGLGNAYLSTGRIEDAIAMQKQALVHNPNFIFSYISLASSYVSQWDWQLSQDPQTLEQALTMGQKAIALNDSFPLTHTVLGYVYLWQKRYDEALAELKRTVTLDPNEALNSGVLAMVLSDMGRTADALQAAAQAQRLKPIVADGHLVGVGAAYAVAGHYEEALEPLQRYLHRYPNILPAHLMLAAVYSELGQTAEAQKEASEVLRLNPNFSLAVHKQRMPIKDPAVLERLIAALRKAGLK